MNDLSSWWTRERIEAEEQVWQRDQFFKIYANDIRNFMREHKLQSVIELGCGSGHIGRELGGEFRYAGYDGSKLMVEFAREKNPGFKFGILDIRDLPKPKIKADLVCSFAVLKHFSLDDWREILTKMLSVGRYAMIQVQVRTQDQPSVEDGGDVHHIWINEEQLLDLVFDAGHKLLELRNTGKDVSPYMTDAMEALLLTQKEEA